MIGRNRQTTKPFFDQELPKIRNNIPRIELAEINLNSQLPGYCGRDVRTVSGIPDCGPGILRESTLVRPPPQQHVRVDQKVQSKPQSRSSSSVIGSNASGVHEILPLNRPGLRGRSAIRMGTILATGSFPFAIMTSSPSRAF